MTALLQKIRWFFVRREIRKIINGLGNDKEVLRGTPREKLLKFHRAGLACIYAAVSEKADSAPSARIASESYLRVASG
jgi:hypothetical protein